VRPTDVSSFVPPTPDAAVHEMSELLNTGLERSSLAVLTQLCDEGFNPEALAQVVRELRAEKEAQRQRREEETAAATK